MPPLADDATPTTMPVAPPAARTSEPRTMRLPVVGKNGGGAAPPAPVPVVTRTVLFLCHTARLEDEDAVALLRLVRSFDGQRVRPLVLLGESGPLVAALADAGVEARVLPLPERVRRVRRADLTLGGLVGRFGTALDLVGYASDLARLARRHGAAAIHAATLRAAVYGGIAGRMARLPVVWHLRGKVTPESYPAAAVRLVRSLSRRLPSLVVGGSREVVESLAPRRPGVARVIPDGLSTEELTAGGITATMRQRKSRDLTVGTIGAVTAGCGLDALLDAGAAVRARAAGDRRPLRFLIVGSPVAPEYAEGLRGQAARLGMADDVEFAAPPEDVWAVLRRLDIFVAVPGTAPGSLGQATLSAMAAGVPVVAADTPAARELITDGETGLLVPPGDARELALALTRLTENPDLRERLGRAAHAQVARSFRASRAARDIEAAYDEALFGASRGRHADCSVAG